MEVVSTAAGTELVEMAAAIIGAAEVDISETTGAASGVTMGATTGTGVTIGATTGTGVTAGATTGVVVVVGAGGGATEVVEGVGATTTGTELKVVGVGVEEDDDWKD